MSEASGSESTAETVDTPEHPGYVDTSTTSATPAAQPKPRGTFRRFFTKFSVFVAVAAGFVIAQFEQNPPETTEPVNPNVNERLVVPQGCEVNRFGEIEDPQCAYNSGIDLGSAPAVSNRTFIEPLPEGVSGRVARDGTDGASPIEFGSLSL